ncbi:hypothetical protein IU438_07205 [Nocardia cyriacigeorgica]|uniref:hypothetical protein n=1 Tax=Nocardia cyriacigeorgica TaxID=135487 RepID=UPI001893C67E|nr:hypothetical protein [Nocardia cyriacigeorgica]MBF6086863.1 hypothetical protein [Nocardia cyriacigeorgica]MBF6090813.1 hypothetical protein [Nocardia cyriacigeorgica]MBF6395576.1 hypothetical protein [Nocardia cyriacigeorgica]MBF6401208.1 hypothetical protein [Nocardia cyriacigeorgica]
MPQSSTPWSRLSQAQAGMPAQDSGGSPDSAAPPSGHAHDHATGPDPVAPPTHPTLLLGGTATVIALLAVVIALFTGHRTPSTPAPEVDPPRVTSAQAPSAAAPVPSPTPGTQGRSVAIGRVAATDGATLKVESLFGTTTTVHTTPSTKVHVLFGSQVADISAGAVIAAYGHKHPDGSITATYLAGAGLDLAR